MKFVLLRSEIMDPFFPAGAAVLEIAEPTESTEVINNLPVLKIIPKKHPNGEKCLDKKLTDLYNCI